MISYAQRLFFVPLVCRVILLSPINVLIRTPADSTLTMTKVYLPPLGVRPIANVLKAIT